MRGGGRGERYVNKREGGGCGRRTAAGGLFPPLSSPPPSHPGAADAERARRAPVVLGGYLRIGFEEEGGVRQLRQTEHDGEVSIRAVRHVLEETAREPLAAHEHNVPGAEVWDQLRQRLRHRDVVWDRGRQDPDGDVVWQRRCWCARRRQPLRRLEHLPEHLLTRGCLAQVSGEGSLRRLDRVRRVEGRRLGLLRLQDHVLLRAEPDGTLEDRLDAPPLDKVLWPHRVAGTLRDEAEPLEQRGRHQPRQSAQRLRARLLRFQPATPAEGCAHLLQRQLDLLAEEALQSLDQLAVLHALAFLPALAVRVRRVAHLRVRRLPTHGGRGPGRRATLEGRARADERRYGPLRDAVECDAEQGGRPDARAFARLHRPLGGLDEGCSEGGGVKLEGGQLADRLHGKGRELAAGRRGRGRRRGGREQVLHQVGERGRLERGEASLRHGPRLRLRL